MTDTVRKAADILYQRSGVEGHAAQTACQEHAQALHDAGLLAPDLPEPSFVMDEDGEKRICWNTPDCDIELEPGEMIITREAQAGHTIEDARQTGLALLAAANYSEEE